MKPLASISLLLAILFLAAGCAPRSTAVQVRLKNAGTVPIENISVNFQGQIEAFGTLAPGATSPYHTVTKTYRYARIEATVAGKLGIMQPTDFVGETLLPPGHYTWPLTGDPQSTEEYGRLLMQASTRDAEP